MPAPNKPCIFLLDHCERCHLAYHMQYYGFVAWAKVLFFLFQVLDYVFRCTLHVINVFQLTHEDRLVSRTPISGSSFIRTMTAIRQSSTWNLMIQRRRSKMIHFIHDAWICNHSCECKLPGSKLSCASQEQGLHYRRYGPVCRRILLIGIFSAQCRPLD